MILAGKVVLIGFLMAFHPVLLVKKMSESKRVFREGDIVQQIHPTYQFHCFILSSVDAEKENSKIVYKRELVGLSLSRIKEMKEKIKKGMPPGIPTGDWDKWVDGVFDGI